MATTENFYTGNASTTSFGYSFPILQNSDLKVELDGVLKTENTSGTNNDYSISGTNVVFNSAPGSSVDIHIYRLTDVDSAKAVFAAGSSIRAGDLNNNVDQSLYADQEQQQKIKTSDIRDIAVTTAKIKDLNVTTAKIADANVTTAKIAADAVNGTKIADDSINSEHYVDGSIDEEHLANSAVSQNKLASNSVGTSQLINGSVNSDKILDGTIVNADVNTSAAIAGTKISPDFGSQNIATTGTVNNVTTTELAILDGATVTTNELNILDGVTSTASELNILDGVTATTAELNYVDGVTSNVQTQLDAKQPLDAELTELATMASGTASALADLTQTEVQTIDGITATTAELNLNDGQTATPSEVNILDGATLNTNELNILDGVTASTTELNLLDGKSVVTTITGSATDAQIPSAQAVNERVVELVTEVGGFHPIANETSFPATNPDINDGAGTIVSIKALSSAFTTGSGVTTHTFTNGAGSGNNVTITGLTQSTTYPAGRGMLLETTTTLHTYTFHRLTLDETGVADAQAAIDDFDEKYYGALSSNPATRPSGANRQNGDLYFNTSDGKMKVYNGSHASGTWDDVAAPGNFFINTLSSSSGSGGGQSAFNGTATRFTLSNPPLTAQQLLVSVNGVVQKPNSGTSPSEGFAIDGADIIFASAPATSAPFFIVTIGSSVNIGTPSDNTVTSAKIVDGTIVNADISSSAAIAKSKLASLDIVNADINASAAIAKSKLASLDVVNADVNASAAIAGTKISPDFGSQNIVTTGSITGNDLEIDSGTLSVDASNNRVGIGTTTIGNKLQVHEASSNASFAGFSNDTTGSSSSDGLIVGVDSDENGVLYHYENKAIRFATNNSERMRIDSSGRLGLGVVPSDFHSNNSAVFQLKDGNSIFSRTGGQFLGIFQNIKYNSSDVTQYIANGLGSAYFQAAGEHKFYTVSSGTANNNATLSERMRIDSSGRVLIGTTTPVLNESGFNEIVVAGKTEGAAIHLADDNNNVQAGMFTSDSGGGTFFIRTITNNPMAFRTNNTERMRIDSSGKVGIGTSSPEVMLDIRADDPSVQLVDTSATNAYGSLSYVGDTLILTSRGGASSHGIIDFRRYNGSTIATSMRIAADGKVGIGTTSPAKLLDVKSESNNTESVYVLRNQTVNLQAKVITTSEAQFGTETSHPFAFITSNVERMRLDSDGGLRVGNTTNIFNSAAAEKVSIKQSSQGNALTLQIDNQTGGFPILYLYSSDTTASQNAIIFYRGGVVGSITTTASSTAYNTTSDYRLKENAKAISDGITRLKTLKPYRFNWKADKDTTVDGFFAHEVTAVPEAVTGTKDEVSTDENGATPKGDPIYQSIDHSKLVPLLTAALQEAIAKIETLETKVTALEAA